MKKSIISLISVLVVISNILLSATDSLKIDFGWKEMAENNFGKAEELFHQAIDEDKTNPRPYLALSFVHQLKEENEEAWNWYKKALQHVDDPSPFVFASMFTNRGLLLNEASEDRGLMQILPDFTGKTDERGVLRAGVIEKLGKFHEEYGDLDLADEYFEKLDAIEKWKLIGPFENISASGYDKEFKPELEFNPEAIYLGKNDMPIKWFKIDKIRRDHWIDLTRYFSHAEAVYYGNTFIYSPKKEKIVLRVGTSGSIKTFLNDELVISCFDENNNDLDTYMVETELQKGWNKLLVKIGYSEITQCNYLVRITDEKGNAVDGLEYTTEVKVYPSSPNAPIIPIRNFAEVYFEKIIDEYPNNIENYLLLSECYLRNDKATEAELVLRKAASKNPNSVLIKTHLLEAYIRGEKYDEVNSTTEKIFELYPDVPFVLEQKFAEYDGKENLEEAEKIATQYSNLLPGSSKSLMMLVTVAAKKGQVKETLQILKEAYEKYPLNWNIVHVSALLAVNTTQNYGVAIEYYDELLKQRRIDDAYIQLGDAYLRTSNVEMFEETFKDLIEKDQAATGIYYTMASVYQQLQDYAKAEEYLESSIQLCPFYSANWSKLGEIKQASGNKEEAIEAYENALKYSNTDYNSRSRLRELEGSGSIFSHFEDIDIDSLIDNSPSDEKYPNDGAVYLLDKMNRVIYPKGASETENEVLIKVFNSDGINSLKEYWLKFNSFSEKLIVDKALVIKKDGTEISADVNQNQIIFKSLEPDEYVYIKWRIQNYYSGRLSPHVWDEVNFSYFYPIETIKYSVLLPKDFNLSYKTQNMDILPVIKEIADGSLYTWQLKDQAAIDNEYNMPSLDDVGKMLFISSIPNWEYLVEWYLDLANTKTRSSYEIKEKVEELLQANPDANEIEKIKLIQNFITENISYSSVSFRQSGLIPQDARDVLVQRIGDCKDVATLCIAMLKEAGINAHYVLVNTFDYGQNKNVLPSIAFNHAIVGVETENGIIYVDLTAQNYPLFTVPFNVQGAFALSIVPGTTEPFYLSQSLFLPSQTKRESIVKVSEDNSAIVNLESNKLGTIAASFRSAYRFKGNYDQKNELAESLSSEIPDVRINNFEIKDIDKIKNNIEYSYEYEIPHFLEDAGTMKLFKLPWSDNLTPRRSLSLENRKYDYIYKASSDSLSEDMQVYLPKGYKPIELPEEIIIKSNVAEYIVQLKYHNGIIKAQRKFIKKKDIISPTEYSEFKEFYNKVVRADAQQILLKKEI